MRVQKTVPGNGKERRQPRAFSELIGRKALIEEVGAIGVVTRVTPDRKAMVRILSEKTRHGKAMGISPEEIDILRTLERIEATGKTITHDPEEMNGKTPKRENIPPGFFVVRPTDIMDDAGEFSYKLIPVESRGEYEQLVRRLEWLRAAQNRNHPRFVGVPLSELILE